MLFEIPRFLSAPQPEFSLEFILLVVFALVIIDQLLYFWLFYSKLGFSKTPSCKRNTEAVSVVICAKNEYSNLKKNLPQILNQDYPDFEVILVNDASDDYTHELLEDFERKYEKLKVITIKENLNFFSGKKFALSIGIKSAKNDLLLLTDADCYPNSPNWIRHMADPFSDPETEIVLGYGPYEKKPGILNAIIRFDTLMVAVQYFSFALKQKAFMGVGRNLAYRKSLFYKNGGFISHYTVRSGDDDLFINSVANKQNTRIQTHPDSYTFSQPKITYTSWATQKRRHFSTSKLYKPKFKFLLGKYGFTQLLMYALLTTFIVLNYNLFWVLLLFSFRLISQYIVVKASMKRLNERNLLVFSPVLELILFANQLMFSFINLFFKPNKWK